MLFRSATTNEVVKLKHSISKLETNGNTGPTITAPESMIIASNRHPNDVDPANHCYCAMEPIYCSIEHLDESIRSRARIHDVPETPYDIHVTIPKTNMDHPYELASTHTATISDLEDDQQASAKTNH